MICFCRFVNNNELSRHRKTHEKPEPKLPWHKVIQENLRVHLDKLKQANSSGSTEDAIPQQKEDVDNLTQSNSAGSIEAEMPQENRDVAHVENLTQANSGSLTNADKERNGTNLDNLTSTMSGSLEVETVQQEGEEATVEDNLPFTDSCCSQDIGAANSCSISQQDRDRSNIDKMTITDPGSSQDIVTTNSCSASQQDADTVCVDNMTSAVLSSTQDSLTNNSCNVPGNMSGADTGRVQEGVTNNSGTGPEQANGEPKHLTCNICDKSFAFNCHFQKHLKMHEHTNDPDYLSSRPFACSYPCCTSQFTKEEYLAMHIQAVHLKNYMNYGYSITCTVCQQGFNKPYFLQKHMQRNHPELWVKLKRPEDKTCRVCRITTKNTKTLSEHIRRHAVTHWRMRATKKCKCKDDSVATMKECFKTGMLSKKESTT